MEPNVFDSDMAAMALVLQGLNIVSALVAFSSENAFCGRNLVCVGTIAITDSKMRTWKHIWKNKNDGRCFVSGIGSGRAYFGTMASICNMDSSR